MGNLVRGCLLAAFIGALVATPTPAASVQTGAVGAGRSVPGVSCRHLQVPVSVSGTPAEIAGTLCARADLSGQTIQILIPGYTYGQTYWDFGYQPEKYSYVRAANAAGIATLNLDRLGIGLSSHLPVHLLNFDNHVAAVQQVVDAVRKGALGASVGKIILVGHSYGSAVASAVQLRYGSANGLILTGYSHVLGFGLARFLYTGTFPAQLDPRFAARPPGYLTTLPGQRAPLFYAAGTFDPEVAKVDEQTKETLSPVEIAGVGLTIDRLATRLINVPVLIVTGDQDTIACGTGPCADIEAQQWSDEAHLAVVSVPNTGHDLNLSYSAPKSFALMNDWMSRSFGPLKRARPGAAPEHGGSVRT
jgi:pimeloyl-ACP methyl ester carboxylesterase